VICFLSYFAANEAFASDVTLGNKTAQTHSEGMKMKLMELMQRLEAAEPWPVEKVSEALGAELIHRPSYRDKAFPSYRAYQLDYGNGLIIDNAEYNLNLKENRMKKLTLQLDKSASCFTLDSLKKIYSDMEKMETYTLSASSFKKRVIPAAIYANGLLRKRSNKGQVQLPLGKQIGSNMRQLMK